jgi:hypothetical protein
LLSFVMSTSVSEQMTCSLILRLGISLFGLTLLQRVVLIPASCVLYALGMDLNKRVYAPICPSNADWLLSS